MTFYSGLEYIGEHIKEERPEYSMIDGILYLNSSLCIKASKYRISQRPIYASIRYNRISLVFYQPKVGFSPITKQCKLFTLADNGIDVTFDPEIEYLVEEDKEELKDIKFLYGIKEWILENGKRYKIRFDGKPFHIKKVFALMQGLLEDLAYAYDKDVVVHRDEEQLKRYLNSYKSEKLYLFATPSLDNYSFNEMDRVIQECYLVSKQTSSNSCMTKSGGDPFKIGADYNQYKYDECYSDEGTFIHPFHAFQTADWRFAFASKYTQEEVIKWDNKDKSPFIARAVLHKGNLRPGNNPKWTLAGRNVCYGDRETTRNGFIDTFGIDDDTENCEIRLYETKWYDFIMPYVDGDYQTCTIIDNDWQMDELEDEDLRYKVAKMGDHSGYSCWTSDGGYAIAEQHHRTVYCEVMEDDIDEEDAVYIDAIEGYVDEQFANSDGTLDGLAIFRWFRR